MNDLRQFNPVGVGEIGNVDAALGATQARRQGDDQQRRKFVLSRVVARVVDRGEDLKNRFHAACLLRKGTRLRILILAASKGFYLGSYSVCC